MGSKNGSSGGCGRGFHIVVSVLMILVGGCLVGFGVYRKVKTNNGPFSLDYEASEVGELDNIWSWVLRLNTAAIVVGVGLILTGLGALIALGRGCLGGVFKVAYVLVALVIMLALVAVSGLSWYLLAKGNDNGLSNFVENGWKNTLANDKDDICAIEKRYQCRGFNNDDCKACPTGVGSSCTPDSRKLCAPCTEGSTQFVGNGCWNEFHNNFRKFYILVGGIASGLAGLLLVDLCVVCSL